MHRKAAQSLIVCNGVGVHGCGCVHGCGEVSGVQEDRKVSV
jgi:hypothetical protein